MTAQVASHLDAMGWEQASPGRNKTAQYWQFTPQEDDLGAASLASEHSIQPADVFESSCQLHTPARGTEQQGNSAQQDTPSRAQGADPRLQPLQSSQGQNNVNGSSHYASPAYVGPDEAAPAQQQQQAPQPEQSSQLSHQEPEIVPIQQHSGLHLEEETEAARPKLLSRPPSASWDAAANNVRSTLAPASPQQEASMAVVNAGSISTPGKLMLKGEAAEAYQTQSTPGMSLPACCCLFLHAAVSSCVLLSLPAC